MRLQSRAGIAALAALVFGGNALAQSRCDCTRIVGNCQAQAAVSGSFIDVTSNTAQCSRVDYVVDGTPFVTLVLDGAARADRPGGAGGPSSVIVQTCQICFDNSAAAASEEFGAGLVADGEVSRLIGVSPAYPPEALAGGVEGFVEVRFQVDADGRVSDPEVVAAEPEGVFEDAALAAVSRWRYTLPADGPQTVTERVEFTLGNALFTLRPGAGGASADAAAGAVAATGTRRNRCIQEDSRYTFGAEVGVSLVNACDEPLFVYSCAAGTGRDRNLWVCSDPESVGTAEVLSAAGRLEITRAPNGEYWWLACAVDDTACRSDGRQWARSTDRQSASIDPQDRTRATLARSF
jgi:TonB family protein